MTAALLAFSPMGVQAAQESVLRDGDRIVVVGDSITGQSAGANGYIGFMREALEKAHPGTKTTLIPLGGSGQTVGSWGGVEKNSREIHLKLDVPDIDVKTTLDGGADVVIIMLGMNNVLRPDMDNSPEAVANWAKGYRELIAALRERTHPRVIAIATPTLCTEDEASLKNKLMDEMSRAMNQIGASEQCIVLPVRESYKRMLRAGRTYRPDFHLAGDYVHPGAEGHLAIATGMLEGLGETTAAKGLFEAHAPGMFRAIAGALPSLSYTLERTSTTNGDEQTFKVRYWLNTELPRPERTAANVELKAREGWKVSPASHSGAEGEFTITGSLDRLQNRFELSATHEGVVTKSEIVIPAPWLVGVGGSNPSGWVNKDGWKFDQTLGRLPADADLTRGIGFDHPLAPDAQWSRIPEWRYYVASVNYTGGNNPGSVDLAGSGAWFGTFDVS